MSDETVRPALTAEEWATLREPYQPGFGEPKRTKGTNAVIEAMHPLDVALNAIRFPNALAAVALCPEFNGGQQRGFTREDVSYILRAIDDAEYGFPAFKDIGAAERLRSLADRIAALLPPETP